ncbi:MAG TPA: hypothetical protein VKT80_17680, partial [Chloroflexota bacterium]|nr:hypothetical protein [Chloroflexota bacterium]
FQHNSLPALDVQAATGQLLELTNKVDIKDWTPLARAAETSKGKIWGVPGGKYTVGIAYHLDLWESAGLTDEPATWADLTAAMIKLQGTKVIPYSIAAKDGSLTYFNYIGLASTILGMDGFDSVVAGTRKLTDPDLVAVIQQMVDWGKYFQPNFVGTPYLEAKALFATKKAAMIDAGSSDFNGFLGINPDLKLGFMYWPAPAGGMAKRCTNTGMEFQVGVNSKGKNLDQSVTFAGWLGTTEGGQAMTDNVKDLSVMVGVKSSNPLQQKMLDTPLDVPVWYERFSTQNIGTPWADKGQGLFTGKTTAADFAKLLQKTIDDQLVLAAKT